MRRSRDHMLQGLDHVRRGCHHVRQGRDHVRQGRDYAWQGCVISSGQLGRQDDTMETEIAAIRAKRKGREEGLFGRKKTDRKGVNKAIEADMNVDK